MRILTYGLGVLYLFFASYAAAQQGADGDIEARTKQVAETIRCVVCKNQSIEESDAALAKDLRNLVRERIEAGDTNQEARAYLVERYGEFVLLKPSFSVKNLALWFGPMMVFLIAVLGAIIFIRSKQAAVMTTPSLSEKEQAELDQYLQEK